MEKNNSVLLLGRETIVSGACGKSKVAKPRYVTVHYYQSGIDKIKFLIIKPSRKIIVRDPGITGSLRGNFVC